MHRWLVVLAAACAAPPDTTDEVCPDTPPLAPKDIVPELGEFSSEGCVPGSLEGFDIEGLWYVQTTSGDSDFLSGPVRFDRKCNALYATGDTYADQTADYVHWGWGYVYDDRALGSSHLACRVEPDGSLWGQQAWYEAGFIRRSEFVAYPFGRIDGEAVAQGVEKLGEWAGPGGARSPWFLSINVRVHDEVAYLIAREGLFIIDVGDPRAPDQLGFFPSRGDAFNDVKIVEAAGGAVYAILASNNTSVAVVDVTDPRAPAEVHRLDPTGDGSTHTLFTQRIDGRTWAYFVDGTNPVLGIYDVTDPSAPIGIARYDASLDLPGLAWVPFHDLYVEGDRAYINATFAGFLILDLADPTRPRIVGRADTGDEYSHSNWVTVAGGRKISVHGGEGYGEHVKIVDVDEQSPTFLEVIGEYRTRDQVSVHNILAIGDRAYVAYYQDGLRILDLSDPTQPRQVAYYNTWNPYRARGYFYEGAYGVHVDDRGLIYVADSESGLLILRETGR